MYVDRERVGWVGGWVGGEHQRSRNEKGRAVVVGGGGGGGDGSVGGKSIDYLLIVLRI